MKTSLIILLITLSALARGGGAQGPAAAGRFEKEGLSFDYPAGWTVADMSNEKLQRLALRREGVSTLIMVSAQREPITTAAQLYASRNSVTLPYVENIARNLGLEKPPPPEASHCVPVGDRFAVGFRMAGRVKNEPTTAEVYTIVLGQRLIHLVHIRADRDEAQGAAAWKTLLDTLKVEPPATPSPEAERIKEIVMEGVINGRALKKPQPDYPGTAKAARASGVVPVQVTVDEKGEVISAQAVTGHPLLRGVSEEAARRAKFSPTTLCGRPVKVSGVITYAFVLN